MPPANAVDFSLGSFTPPAGNSVDFELSAGSLSSFLLGFGVRKKLGKPEWEDPLNVYGIYQMRKTSRGKIYIKEKFYTPTNPQTVAQQANRAKFASAMSAWQSLTSEQKSEYNQRAKPMQMFGRNLYIREYYQNN